MFLTAEQITSTIVSTTQYTCINTRICTSSDTHIVQYYQELIIVVRESIQHAIGTCTMSA